MVKRRASVSHRPVPFLGADGCPPLAPPLCLGCRRAIRFRPQVVGRGAHWTHLPRPRTMSTSGH